ncbi:MAG: lipid-A-disaccharide synthase, partial [Verrucomicrobiota bacterium]
KVNALTYVVGKSVIRIKYLGIINILAEAPVVKEMVQGQFEPDILGQEMVRLLQDRNAREELTAKLKETVSKLGEGGAYQRAAAAVIAELNMAELEPLA